MAWPSYESLFPKTFSLTHLKYFLTDRRSLRTAVLLIVLIMIYVSGTHIPLPFANTRRLHQILVQIPLLAVFNDLFTGGGLGNAAPFALGVATIPFPLFKTVELEGSGSRVNNYFAWSSFFAIIMLVAIVVAWFTYSSIIPATPVGIGATAACLLLGAIVVFYMEYFFEAHWGTGIIALNALIIGGMYVQRLLTDRYLLDIAPGVLLIAFFFSFGFLIRRVKEVHLLNISEQEVREGSLPIPATNNVLQMIFLIFTLIVVVIVTPLLNLFAPLKFNPFGNALPEISVFIIMQVLVIILFFSVKFIDEAFNTFNSVTIAKRLFFDNWIIPNVEVGRPTAMYLRNQISFAHRITYLFYLAWTLLFSTLILVAQFTQQPITPLPYGIIVFLIILTLCSQVLYESIRSVHNYLRRISFREFWATLASSSSRLSIEFFAETASIKELIMTLPGLTAEEKNTLLHVLDSWELGKASPKDLLILLKIFSIALARLRSQSKELPVTATQIWIKCGLSLLLAVIFTALTILLTQLFFAPIVGDIGFKATMLAGLIALFVAFSTAWGVLQDITALVRH